MLDKMQDKMSNAVKWSILAECVAKLITPFTSMILARILAPEEYGILAVVTMITSFADMFTDAGFQKFLIQHKFSDEKELLDFANVAFGTNLAISILFWIGIMAFSPMITGVMNIPGYEMAVIVASLKLILTTFSSIQRALYQRRFDYETIFYVRVFCCLIPIVLTIPLALLGLGYWSLIIGTIANEAVYAMVLTIRSTWKPKFFYNLSVLKRMLSFSLWSLVEQISIWLTSYVDTIIVSHYLNSYYLGIYKQPENMITSIYSVFTSSVFVILFSALARCNDNNDKKEFANIFFNVQFGVALLIIPMSIGIFCYRDLVTGILLGSQWPDSQIVIGLVALSQGLQLVLNNPVSEVYRAKGEPKVSALAQFLYISFYIPVLIFGVHHTFEIFVSTRAASVLTFICINYIIIKMRYGFSFIKSLQNITIPVLCSLLMGLLALGFIKLSHGNIIFEVLSILACFFIYGFLICCFKKSRKFMLIFLQKALKKEKKVAFITHVISLINYIWK